MAAVPKMASFASHTSEAESRPAEKLAQPLWVDIIAGIHREVGDIDFGGAKYAAAAASYKAALLRVFGTADVDQIAEDVEFAEDDNFVRRMDAPASTAIQSVPATEKLAQGMDAMAAALGVVCDVDIIHAPAFKRVFADHHLAKVAKAAAALREAA